MRLLVGDVAQPEQSAEQGLIVDKRGLVPGTDRVLANAGSKALCSFVVQ
jgi:hypothetical protein